MSLGGEKSTCQNTGMKFSFWKHNQARTRNNNQIRRKKNFIQTSKHVYTWKLDRKVTFFGQKLSKTNTETKSFPPLLSEKHLVHPKICFIISIIIIIIMTRCPQVGGQHTTSHQNSIFIIFVSLKLTILLCQAEPKITMMKMES